MLPASERLDAQLEARLATRRVYALGGPGSSLLDYAERVRFAADRFAIKDFVVVIEQGDIKQTLCGSGNVHGPCLDPDDLRPRIERLPEADAGKRLLRHSAFAQYLVSQLQVNPGRLLKRIDPRQWLDTSERSKRDSAAPATTVERDTRIVTAFLTYLPRSNGERYVLIFDSPLRQRSDDASHSASTVMFMAQARQAAAASRRLPRRSAPAAARPRRTASATARRAWAGRGSGRGAGPGARGGAAPPRPGGRRAEVRPLRREPRRPGRGPLPPPGLEPGHQRHRQGGQTPRGVEGALAAHPLGGTRPAQPAVVRARGDARGQAGAASGHRGGRGGPGGGRF